MSVIILDDRDSSIQYEGDWSKGGDPDVEYLGTTMFCTPASGTTATLQFIGTGVAVFGTVQASGVQTSTYELDGDVTRFNTRGDSSTRFSQEFFSTDNLAHSHHTLVVTPVKGTLLIDYITVQVPSMTGVQSVETVTTTIFETVTTSIFNGTPITVTHNLTTTASAVTQAQDPTPSQNQTDLNVSKVPADNHMRPVIGGALGGLGALLLMLFAYLFIRRRKTKKASKPRLSATPYHLSVPHTRSIGDVLDLAGSVSSNIAQHDHNSEQQQSANLTLKRTSRRESTNHVENLPSDTRAMTRAPSPPPIYQSEMGVENRGNQ